MATVAANLMTVEEFERLGNELRVELVAGELRDLPMPGTKHGVLCAWIAYLLQRWVGAHGQGLVLTNDSFILTRHDPDSARGADVCYIRKDRLPDGVPDGTLRIPPGLVVEVLSPSDRWDDVMDKVTEYLAVGVTEVWVVNGTKRLVDVFHIDRGPRRIGGSEELTSPDVLPGFSTTAAELFRNV